MPLDDIFHEKSKQSDAKQLQIFWRWCTVIIGGIVALTIIIHDISKSSFLFIETISAIFIVVCLPVLFTAYLFSKLFSYLIPYQNFSMEEKAGIYFYIISSLLFLAYFLFLLDEFFYDSVVFDWLFENF